MFLENYWYVAALSSEVTTGLMSRRLFGVDTLFYRKADGTVVAMEDRCLHRRVSLSSGRLIDDKIQCGYHGLQFNAEGRCVHIPGQDRIPAQACLPTYLLVERDGFIWIWYGKSKDKADFSLIPDFSRFASPAWARSLKQEHTTGHGLFGVENSLDSTHVAYVHSSSFTDDIVSGFKVQNILDGDTVTIRRSIYDIPVPPLFGKVMGIEGNADRLQEIKFSPPFNIFLHSGVWPAGISGQDACRNMYIYSQTTPDTLQSSWIFVQIWWDFAVDNQKVYDYFTHQLYTALAEDKIVIEQQQANWNYDGPDSQMLDIALDGAPLAARRVLERLYRTQAGRDDIQMPWFSQPPR